MPVEKDVFGFDELKKAFDKCDKKYPNNADALLMAHGQAVQKKTKADTLVYKGKIPPGSKIKPGQLKRSWRVKKPKLYQSEKYRVVRIQSEAPHSHLIEDGHEIYRVKSGSRAKSLRGKKLRSYEKKYSSDISSHGRTEGEHMLAKAISEARSRFEHDAEKMIDDLTRDIRV